MSFSDNKKGEAVLSVRLFDADPSVCTDSFIASQKMNEVLEGAAVVGKALGAAKIFVLHDKTDKIPENVPYKNMEFVKVPAARQLMCGKREIDIILADNKYEYETSVAIDSTTAFSAYEAVVLQKPLLERLRRSFIRNTASAVD